MYHVSAPTNLGFSSLGPIAQGSTLPTPLLLLLSGSPSLFLSFLRRLRCVLEEVIKVGALFTDDAVKGLDRLVAVTYV